VSPARRAPEGAADSTAAGPWLWLPVVLRGRVARVQHFNNIKNFCHVNQSGPGGVEGATEDQHKYKKL
jgi:hypothetical protein